MGEFSPDDTAFKQWLRSGWGDFLSNWAIEVMFAVPDLMEPWQNPYFSTEQRVVQNLVTGGGTLAAAGTGTLVGYALAGAQLGVWGGPVTFVLGTAAGVLVFVVWEHGVKPTVSWAAPRIGLRDPYQEYYNLKPLGGGQ